ncbi:hypothetical protein HAX54_002302 [Datura stramonium]|uniref:Uncharacterized protein n=1 Tax=Datura stramonium TaxID=4076 RepID=A0ABS8T4W3_DATST|nr:hypothetical protein [Datura stramonium]
MRKFDEKQSKSIKGKEISVDSGIKKSIVDTCKEQIHRNSRDTARNFKVKGQNQAESSKTRPPKTRVIFKNIAPTANEKEQYQLTEPGIIVVEANTSTNQDDFADFSSTHPLMCHKRPNQDDGSVPSKPPKKSKIEVADKQIQKKFTIQKRLSHEIKNKQAQSSELPINKNVTPTSHDAEEEKADRSRSEQDEIALLRQDIDLMNNYNWSTVLKSHNESM